MKKACRLTGCIIIAYILLLVPYLIYFIRIAPYDITLGIQVSRVGGFWPLYSSFIWSVPAGGILCYLFNGRYFKRFSKDVSIQKDFKKKQAAFTAMTLAGLAVAGCLLEISRVYSNLSNIIDDFYFMFTGTKQLMAAASMEVWKHIDTVATYFQTAVIPDFQKILNLLVMYLSYQLMRFLFDSRARE